MNDYKDVYYYLDQLIPDGEPFDFGKGVVPCLVSVWLDLYSASPGADIVQVRCDGFDYLFDNTESRLISAWDVNRGASHVPRGSNRMRGHPLSEGRPHHRGYTIPHWMGGARTSASCRSKAMTMSGRFVSSRDRRRCPGSRDMGRTQRRTTQDNCPNFVGHQS